MFLSFERPTPLGTYSMIFMTDKIFDICSCRRNVLTHDISLYVTLTIAAGALYEKSKCAFETVLDISRSFVANDVILLRIDLFYLQRHVSRNIYLLVNNLCMKSSPFCFKSSAHLTVTRSNTCHF